MLALDQFRKIVTAMGLGNPPYDNPYLLRFLRARKFDLKKTEKMFVDFIAWRKEKDVDNIQVLSSQCYHIFNFLQRTIAFQK